MKPRFKPLPNNILPTMISNFAVTESTKSRDIFRTYLSKIRQNAIFTCIPET